MKIHTSYFTFAMLCILVTGGTYLCLSLSSCDDAQHRAAQQESVNSFKHEASLDLMTSKGRVSYYQELIKRSRTIRKYRGTTFRTETKALLVEVEALKGISQELLDWRE